MNILVFNCGSSSLNYKVFAARPPDLLEPTAAGKAHRVGVRGSEPSFIEHREGNSEPARLVTPIQNHRQAAELIFQRLAERGIQVDGIGHRIVHGGSYFLESELITPEAMERLRLCLPLSPNHNPSAYSVIEASQSLLPGITQYLVFDTAFHANLPEVAYRYALPAGLAQEYKLRRYGFHGLSYRYVIEKAAQSLGRPLKALRLVACHLGTGGSSVAAIQDGHSVDTSMGYTPISGVMMSTRTGDLDPLLTLYLVRHSGKDTSDLVNLISSKSGLLGISGFSSDIRDLIKAVDERGDERAALALEMYTYQIRRRVGAYAADLGGIDALIFTDDIGVQNSRVRARICDDLGWCGITLDPEANAAAPANRLVKVSAVGSPVAVLTIPTDEERVIGLDGLRLLTGGVHVNL